MKITTLLVLFFSFHVLCYTQKAKTMIKIDIDTLQIDSGHKLLIKFPEKTIRNSTKYADGFLISYFIPTDTVMISIYSGSLSKVPFVSGTSCQVTDSLIVEEILYDRKGHCLISDDIYKKKNTYFREKEYSILMFTVRYEWVSASKLAKYDEIINNIEVLEKQ